MEIVKSPEGNYHIAANKDEWFVIHFFMNFFNENYDEIDEGILFHFGVEEDVAKIAEKVNRIFLIVMKIILFLKIKKWNCLLIS